MMEGGYLPAYKQTHIVFGLDDNLGVVEYEEGILSVRVFFSIEEEAYGIFLEASNRSMAECFVVKPVLLDDMKSIMFSFEMMCDNVREFRKFFPRSLELIREALTIHKKEMKHLILAESLAEKAIPATEEFTSVAGKGKPLKLLS